ncbi:hypothetical protein CMK12_08605 [Candidatus Poribacteria bacterium]|nr:hypothetical protein [Candidatus Poribacteria bacterium]
MVPNLVSYPLFIIRVKSIWLPLNFFLPPLTGEATGIYLVDSTILKACHIKPEPPNRVFRGVITKARSTIGRFFGFKLHLVINDVGEIMAFKITAGYVKEHARFLICSYTCYHRIYRSSSKVIVGFHPKRSSVRATSVAL